jgi:uncharacterized protein YcfJ
MLCLIKGFCSREDHTVKSWKQIAIGFICLLVLIGVAACGGQPLSTRETATLGGAGLGAATGAIIGAAVGSPGAGAAIGGALGGVGGFAVGSNMQNQEAQQAQTQQALAQQQRQLELQRREIQRLRAQQEAT